MIGPNAAASGLSAFTVLALGFVVAAAGSFLLSLLPGKRPLANVLPGHHAEGPFR